MVLFRHWSLKATAMAHLLNIMSYSLSWNGGKLATATVFFLVVTHVSTTAGELCVVCEAPSQSYRCKFPDVDLGRASGAAGRLACITVLAKHGGHRRCKIERKQPGFSCLGKVRVLSPEGQILDGTGERVTSPATKPEASPAQTDDAAGIDSPQDATPTTAPADDTPAREEKTNDKPPKTVEEFARNTAKQSSENLEKAGKQIGKAGDAIAGAAKKTWDCIASLFTSC